MVCCESGQKQLMFVNFLDRFLPEDDSKILNVKTTYILSTWIPVWCV